MNKPTIINYRISKKHIGDLFFKLQNSLSEFVEFLNNNPIIKNKNPVTFIELRSSDVFKYFSYIVRYYIPNFGFIDCGLPVIMSEMRWPGYEIDSIVISMRGLLYITSAYEECNALPDQDLIDMRLEIEDDVIQAIHFACKLHSNGEYVLHSYDMDTI